MHYFKFHISDYKSHTEHLDEMEDLAYRRILDWLYLHEKALPKSVEEIARLIRMRTHCDCIANVLHEFMTETEDGYINDRCQLELKEFLKKSKTSKKAADARWKKESAKRRSENNSLSDDAGALQAQCESNANHKPLTTNHKPLTTNKKETKKAFTKPSFEEVSNYCVERNNEINAEAFIDFYTSNGWKVGKNSMKDWKSSVRTWERNNVTRGKQAVSGKSDSKATQFHNKLKDRYEEAVARELDSEAVQQIPSHLRSQMVIDS